MTDTKFKYNDHIIIKYGFHRGMAGKVNKRTESGHFKKIVEYTIKTDTGNLDVIVNEDQIELVGHK